MVVFMCEELKKTDIIKKDVGSNHPDIAICVEYMELSKKINKIFMNSLGPYFSKETVNYLKRLE